MKNNKPRVRFCWECSRKLQGNHHVEMVIDGHPRILHKSCAKAYQKTKLTVMPKGLVEEMWLSGERTINNGGG